MNPMLQSYARKEILDGLSELPEDCQNKFKLMYGKETDSIQEVVENLPEGKLDWAMVQVNYSLGRVK